MATLDIAKFQSLYSEQLGWGNYGSEQALCVSLKDFLDSIPLDCGYDHELLATKVGAAFAWSLIYQFVALGWINYGTSPRYGWLEGDGVWLKAFVATRSADDLYAIAYGDESKELATGEKEEN